MPLTRSYDTSFTGGSPYELGAVEHAYDQEDEEEKREHELAVIRARSYAESAKRMDEQRDVRLGRTTQTMEQQIADPYSNLYESVPGPAQEIQFSEGKEPLQKHLFRPSVQQVTPGAAAKISLFRSANRSGSAMSPEEFAQREQIKAQHKVAAAKEINEMRNASQTAGQKFDASKAKLAILAKYGNLNEAEIDNILNQGMGVDQGPNPLAPLAGQLAGAAGMFGDALGAVGMSPARLFGGPAPAQAQPAPEKPELTTDADPGTRDIAKAYDESSKGFGAGEFEEAAANMYGPDPSKQSLNVRIGGKVVTMTPQELEEYRRQRRNQTR